MPTGSISRDGIRAWSEHAGIPNDVGLRQFANAMKEQGDAVMKRLRYHTHGAGFHLSEQLDKNTGFEIAAEDLTWSYAATLKAWWHRGKLLEIL